MGSSAPMAATPSLARGRRRAWASTWRVARHQEVSSSISASARASWRANCVTIAWATPWLASSTRPRRGGPLRYNHGSEGLGHLEQGLHELAVRRGVLHYSFFLKRCGVSNLAYTSLRPAMTDEWRAVLVPRRHHIVAIAESKK